MSQQAQTTAAMVSLTITDVDDDFVLVQPEQRIGLPGGPEFLEGQSEGRQWADQILKVMTFCELPLQTQPSTAADDIAREERVRNDIARGIVANMVLEKPIAIEEITPYQELFSFMFAGFKGDVEALKELVPADLSNSSGSSMVRKFEDFWIKGTVRGALFMAVKRGHVDAVAAILDSGLDVNNMRDKDGRSTVCHATESKQVEVLRLLLSRGARADAMARDGQTAFHRFGASVAHEREVKVLIEYGAEVNALKSNGEPELYCHAAGGNEAGVKQLLKLGANPSTRTSSRWCSLHWATNGGHLGTVKLLVEAGAEVNNRSDTGQTPLDLIDRQISVADGAHAEALAFTWKYLVEHGARTSRYSYPPS